MVSSNPFFKASTITACPIETSLIPPILTSSGKFNRFKSWPAFTNKLEEFAFKINSEREEIIERSPASMLLENWPVWISIPSTPISRA